MSYDNLNCQRMGFLPLSVYALDSSSLQGPCHEATLGLDFVLSLEDVET